MSPRERGVAVTGVVLPASPRVAIVVVSFAINDEVVADGCIAALAESTYANFQIVVCENGGAEAIARTVRRFDRLAALRVAAPGEEAAASVVTALPRRDYIVAAGGQPVTVLTAPGNLGYAGGVNICIAALSGAWDALWILNPDTFPGREALAALVERQRSGGYGIVGSRLVSAVDGRIHTWGGIEWLPWLGRGRLLGRNASADIVPDSVALERRFGFISGASMFVARAYIDAVGVMDDDFFLYCEDVDWCLRGKDFRFGYAHQSIVRHIHGATTGSSLHKRSRSRLNIYLTERNRILLMRKCFGKLWGLAAALAFVQLLEYPLRERSLRQLRIGLQGWRAGLSGETGAPPFIAGGARDRPSRAADSGNVQINRQPMQ